MENKMKRLHIAASRFEKLVPQTIEIMADPSWTHLGETEVDWRNQFKTEWQFGNRLNCVRILYRAFKPRYTSQQLEHFYSKTDFRKFEYQAADRLNFEDNTFDFIFSEHFFEHLFLDEAIDLLQECYRILKPNGVVRIVVPDADLRTYEQPETLGFPNNRVPWSHPDKHKTRWSIYSLPIAIKMSGLVHNEIMYTDKYGKFFDLTPSESDSKYKHSEDKRFIYSIDYIRRLPSLIVDGIKI
jgi:predicted SAM-dependent methyltransferase